MSILNSDASHLYHDSHFTTVSGGVLEAREHMKAREVNAREERLLRQQDQQLQQARETCRKRSRWEQNSIRRDLKTILERTPTFDRSLKDEKRKLQTRRNCRLSPQRKDTLSRSRHRHTDSLGHNSTSTLHYLPTPAVPSPKATSSMRKSDPPLFVDGAESIKRWRDEVKDHQPVHYSHSRQRNLQRVGEDKEMERLMHVRPMPRAHKYTTPGNHVRALSRTLDSAARLTSSTSNLPLSSPDLSSQAQGKGADLRRRSHHAVMAIVRVQARHERRMREADAILARAAAARRNRASGRGQRLTELSKLFTADRSPEAPQQSEVSSDPLFSKDGAPHARVSWLSMPLAHMRDRDEAKDAVRDTGTQLIRPRFYSVE